MKFNVARVCLLLLASLVGVILLEHFVLHLFHKRIVSSTALQVRAMRQSLQNNTSKTGWGDGGRWVVYVCQGGCGGLADRQKGMVAAYLLAQMTRRRVGIAVTSPCSLQNQLNPNTVDWRVEDRILGTRGAKRFVSMDQAGGAFGRTLATADLNSTFPEDVLLLTTNMEWVQFLKKNAKYAPHSPELSLSGDVSQVYARVLRSLFTLKPDLQAQFQTFRKQIGDRKLACAHVRYGKNPSFPNDVNPRPYIGKLGSVWQFLQGYQERGFRVFVASDSEAVRQEAQTIFHDNLVQIPGEVMHVDKSGQSDKACQAVGKVLLDQEALASCDVLMVSHSGFSAVASFLRSSSRDLFCLLGNLTIVPCLPDHIQTLIPIGW